MSGRRNSRDMVVRKSKKQVLSHSTPDRSLDSPSRDSDFETFSPLSLPASQDVGWNYNGTSSKISQEISTPTSLKEKKPHRLNLSETQKPKSYKRRIKKPSPAKIQLPSQLWELNNYVKHEFNAKKTETECDRSAENSRSCNDAVPGEIDSSPKSTHRCRKSLRRNVLTPKSSTAECENGLDSDDSINEHLIVASQAVEESVNDAPTHQSSSDDNTQPLLTDLPSCRDDSFDNLVENLNDSALERLTQMQVVNLSSNGIKTSKEKETSSITEDFMCHDTGPSQFTLARHSSMPESPSVANDNRPSSTGMTIGRHQSMPHNDRCVKVSGDFPTRCTPLEIQKKRQQAWEKLMAKRLLSCSQTQNPVPLSSQVNGQTIDTLKRGMFQLRVPSTKLANLQETKPFIKLEQTSSKPNTGSARIDPRSQIEKKRQEAMKKLWAKQSKAQ